MWNNFGQQLYDNIILNDRWKLYLDGLGTTILVTLGAAVIGVIIGSLVAICKVYAKDNKKLWLPEKLCDLYLTVFRGTPVMVQLLIFSAVIFVSVPMDQLAVVGMLAFGINSGAYVAEIVRAGILAVNPGQTEAGRSLGLTKNMTMRLIILPQAIKNILPALANEAITLLKETAILGYIAVSDLTYQAAFIRNRTYSPVPLLVIAIVYLGVVMLMTFGMRKLERRLARSER